MATNILKRTFGTLIIPASVFAALMAICALHGASLFQTGDSVLILTRGIAVTMLTTIALSINLNSGRFDFSLGSMATLSSVLSATVCIQTGGGAIQMLLLSLVFGTLLGLFSGAVYILLGISPMVCSLGITLLFEGISFAITGGANVSFVMNNGLTSFAKNPLNMVIIIVLALIFIIALFDGTKFGYDYKALLTGQKIAVNTGIKEKLNALICYAVCGALMSVVGFITASQMGYIEAGKLNFGSIGIMFTAFLPMFIGGLIGRYSNDKLGYMLGAFCTTLIGMSYSALKLTSSTQSIITALLLVIFLIYLSNEKQIKRLQTKRRKGVTK